MYTPFTTVKYITHNTNIPHIKENKIINMICKTSKTCICVDHSNVKSWARLEMFGRNQLRISLWLFLHLCSSCWVERFSNFIFKWFYPSGFIDSWLYSTGFLLTSLARPTCASKTCLQNARLSLAGFFFKQNGGLFYLYLPRNENNIILIMFREFI
jgi:hypothetical protein